VIEWIYWRLLAFSDVLTIYGFARRPGLISKIVLGIADASDALALMIIRRIRS